MKAKTGRARTPRERPWLCRCYFGDASFEETETEAAGVA
jgi:hypothetical protein